MKASFRVEIAARAEVDMGAIHDHIAQDSKQRARKWLRGALAAARSLRSLPERFEVIPEADSLDLDYRHLLFGNYRIFYRVEERRVRVMRVIHAARQLTAEMFEGEPP
jgi:plasmid stabilization system protein ParE